MSKHRRGYKETARASILGLLPTDAWPHDNCLYAVSIKLSRRKIHYMAKGKSTPDHHTHRWLPQSLKHAIVSNIVVSCGIMKNNLYWIQGAQACYRMTMPLCTRSPDLIPTEHIWDKLKPRQYPMSMPDLSNALTAEWASPYNHAPNCRGNARKTGWNTIQMESQQTTKH